MSYLITPVHPFIIQETQEEASQKKREERDAQDFTAPVEQAVERAPAAAAQSQDLTLESLKEKFSKKNKKEQSDGSKKRKASAEDDAQVFLQSALVGDSSKKAKKEKREKKEKTNKE